MAADSPYTSGTSGIDYYGSYSGSTEADLRSEFDRTLLGGFPEVAKGQPGLLRRMRRDSSGALQACSCVDVVTGEPDRDRLCLICLGEGYYWDEEDVTFYKVLKDSDVDNALSDTLRNPGLINTQLVVFYVRYDSEITENDKVVELVLGTDGIADTPEKRLAIYRINKVWAYRADNGRLEYYKVFTHAEKVKWLNTPSFGEA